MDENLEIFLDKLVKDEITIKKLVYIQFEFLIGPNKNIFYLALIIKLNIQINITPNLHHNNFK